MTNEEEEVNEKYDQKIKVMIIGETEVGKTALITKYTRDMFGGHYLTTIGIDFQNKYININGKTIKMEIWDTAGQERFRNIAKNYFQTSDGFLLVYDTTNKKSFEKLNYWTEQISLNAEENTKYIVVGNKSDLEGKRQVDKEEGEKFAKENKVQFYETSAKTGLNVNKVFELLAKEIIDDEQGIKRKNKRCSQVLRRKNTPKEVKSCC